MGRPAVPRLRNALVSLALVAGTTLGSVAALTTAASASTAAVTNCNDAGAGSLRQVVADAAPGDTIQVAPGPACPVITLTSGEIDIARDLTIVGPGADVLSVSGNGASTVFAVDAGATVSISGLTVEDGDDVTSSGGGGIRNDGTVEISHSYVTGNASVVGGAGVFNDGTATVDASTIAGNDGEGLHNSGTATVTDSTISGNTGASGDGVWSDGVTTLVGDTIVANGGYGLDAESSTTTVSTTILAGNAPDCTGRVTSGGYNVGGPTAPDCGISQPTDTFTTAPDLGPLADNGGPAPTMLPATTSIAVGAIPAGTVLGSTAVCPRIDERGIASAPGASCSIGAVEPRTVYVARGGSDSGNSCLDRTQACATVSHALGVVGPGGTIDVSGTVADNVTVPASISPVVITGEGASGPAVIDGAGQGPVVTVDDGTLASLEDLTIENGDAGTADGGGIANSGTLTLSDTTISGNSAGAGGGIDNVGTVTISDSTVSGNSAGTGGGVDNVGTATISDSTVSGNSAGTGGGVAATSGTLTMVADTIADNAATGVGGGITGSVADRAGATIVADNTAGGGGPNCSGVVASTGYDLTDDATGAACGFGLPTDLGGVDPGLGPLGDNGGPTRTQLPTVGGPAVDVIPPGVDVGPVTACPTLDQRGVTSNGRCSIGAVEAGPRPTGTTLSASPAPASDVFIADYGSGRVLQVPGDGGPQSTVASGLGFLLGIAVDTGRDIFVDSIPAGLAPTSLTKLPADGGPQTSVGSGLLGPYGIAVDAAGNLFVAQSGADQVTELPVGGGAPVSLGSGLRSPVGTAVDAAGDVYIADDYNHRVVEEPAGGGPQRTVWTGADFPGGVAVDAAGNLYVSVGNRSGAGQVVEVPAGGGPPATVMSGLNGPVGVAVDATGDVFVADVENNRVVEAPAGGGPPTSVGTGLTMPYGVAVDVPVTRTAFGVPVHLTATVQTSPTGGTPTGAVDFTDGSVSLGSAPVVAADTATATLSTAGLAVGTHEVTATYTGDPTHDGSPASAPITVVVARATPTSPTISDLPASGTVGGHFTAQVSTDGDGSRSIASSTTAVCTVTGFVVTFVGAGTCALTAQVGAGTDYDAASGTAQAIHVATVVPGCSATGVGSASAPSGYWIAGADGAVYSCGDAPFYGSLTGLGVRPAHPIVGIAATADRRGYWLVGSDGGVFAFGDAAFYGGMGGSHLNDPVVGMAAAPGGGYYEVAGDGGLFAFGPGAVFHGSMGGRPLNHAVVGMAVAPTGGYYEVAGDGGVFAFGPGAVFHGSMGGRPLNHPVVGMAVAPTGGYYEVAGDGGVFAFGAPFHGSTGCLALSAPITAIVVPTDTVDVGSGSACGPIGTQAPGGYRFVAADGGVFSFGNAAFAGSLGGRGITDVVGLADS